MSVIFKVLLFLLPIVSLIIGLSIAQVLLIWVISLFLYILTCKAFDSKYKYPPGPVGLPLVGCLPALMYYGAEDYLSKVAKKFGKIAYLDVGIDKMIVINDFEMMKEFTVHPSFVGRPLNGTMHLMMKGYGVIDSEGNRWKHQRRFLLHALRDSGMGKMQIEEKINHQMEIVTKEISKSNEKPLYINRILQKATCNVIFGLAFNKTFDFDDPVFINRIDKLDENVALSVKILITTMSKALQIFSKNDIKRLLENMEVFHVQSDDFIVEHSATVDQENPRDLLDLFLIEMNKEPSLENEEYQQTFTEKQMKNLIIDVFGAGTETSSNTIRWAILYMLYNPDIQKKVQQEIDEVIGQNRAPTMSDKPNLPFTVATIQEVERLGTVVPRALPRSNPYPAKFREYSFPARCTFVMNIYEIHRDPKLWKDPELFCPNRFIDAEGKVSRPPFLIPFGCGKRSCAGEALARMEVFLFFVTLMQNFTFLPPDGKLPEIIPMSGIARSPKEFKVVAKSRL